MTEFKKGGGSDKGFADSSDTRVTTPGDLPHVIDRLTRPSDVGVVMGENQADRTTTEIGDRVLFALKDIARPTIEGVVPSEDDLMQGRHPVEFHVSTMTQQKPVMPVDEFSEDDSRPPRIGRRTVEYDDGEMTPTQLPTADKSDKTLPSLVRLKQRTAIYALLGFVAAVGGVSTFVALSKSESSTLEKDTIGKIENDQHDAGADGGNPSKK